MSIELYKKAFEIKKSRLWNIVMEEQIFAVRKAAGEMAYVQVGRNDDGERTVRVYYGEDSLEMARRLLDEDFITMADDEEALHLEAAIEGVELVFTNKSELDEEQIRDAAAAAKECDVRLGGAGAYPAFFRLHRGEPGSPVLEKNDKEMMERALGALQYLVKDQDDSMRLFIPASVTTAYDMMVLEASRGRYKRGLTPVPALQKMKYPTGSNCNEILQKRLKKMKKKGCWVCRIKRMTESIEWGVNGRQVMASYLDTIDIPAREHVNVTPVAYYESRTEVVLDKFMEATVQYGSCPAKICVMDERTYSLLKQWCKNCGIKLEMEEYIPELDIPEALFDEDFDPEEMLMNEVAFLDNALEFFLTMSDEDLINMRDEVQALRVMKPRENDTYFPDSLKKKLDKLIKRMDKLGI